MPTPQEVELLAVPDRLESWKEIAAYLRRSERTVRRWERNERLPVHRLRHDQRGSVYAHARELDAWRESRRYPSEATTPSSRVWGSQARSKSLAWVFVIIGLSVAAAGLLKRSQPATYVPNPEAVLLAERAAIFGTNPGRVQIEAGISTLREAIRIDPKYGGAWGQLATAHTALLWFGEKPVAELARVARQEAQEALRLDATLEAPHRVMGFIHHYVDYDHKTAEADFRMAISLNPKSAVALSWFGDFLTDLRRFDEARASYRRSQEAGPRWLEPLTFAANTALFSGHPQQAVAEYTRVLQFQPNYSLANHYLGLALLDAGQHEAALSRLRKSDELLGHVPFSQADLGYGLARAGYRVEAERMLDEMMRRRAESYYPAFPVAQIHLGLGRTEAALDWLEKAVDERHVGFYLPAVGPFYDALRDFPRFRRILERINISL